MPADIGCSTSSNSFRVANEQKQKSKIEKKISPSGCGVSKTIESGSETRQKRHLWRGSTYDFESEMGRLGLTLSLVRFSAIIFLSPPSWNTLFGFFWASERTDHKRFWSMDWGSGGRWFPFDRISSDRLSPAHGGVEWTVDWRACPNLNARHTIPKNERGHILERISALNNYL